MNWKLIIVGGIVFYAAAFVVSMGTGPLIHEGVLDPLYRANSEFWRPELNQDPPDMAALMPRWIAMGLLTSLVFASIYGWIGKAFGTPGWKSGLRYGLMLGVVATCYSIGWSGVFNLPDAIWGWWSVESFLTNMAGGAALGWVATRFA